jgi:hypothetical protein
MTVRLLFDLDETIYMGDVIKVAVQQLDDEGIDLSPSQDNEGAVYSGETAADYSFSNFPKILRTRILKLFNDPYHACLNKYALAGVFPFLSYAKKVKQWSIGYVTSRPLLLKTPTEFMLWKDFPGIEWDGRFFSNSGNSVTSGVSKKKYIEKFQPTHYFDDHYDYCCEALQAGVQNVYLITNSHTGWNHKHLADLGDDIKPIKSILELDLR